MGDKVAQLIFEKIETPAMKEVNSLEDTNQEIKDSDQPESRLPHNQLSQRPRTNQCPRSV